MTLSEGDIDEIDAAILDYLLKGRTEDGPWGKATPSEVYRGLEESGRLEKIGNPVQATIQNRIQRLELAGHLENKFSSGCYEFVSDPRDNED